MPVAACRDARHGRTLIDAAASVPLARMPKPTPAGWPRVASSIFYDDANAAIDFLCRAFGFEVKIKVDGEPGVVVHSELTWGSDGLVMVGTARRAWAKSPRAISGACTQSLMIYVDDVDGFVAHARANGAAVLSEPTDIDYGEGYWVDRGAELRDPEGHHWWIVQRLRDR
jgi:uncharacterized glyoxalase superfamily protein PhnB